METLTQMHEENILNFFFVLPQCARALSRKAVALFQLMAQQLSKQDHYDFGLRPIRAALQRAGEIKRSASESTTEQAVIIQAIMDMVVPKTVPDDLEILYALVKDMFPEAEIAEVSRELARKTFCRIVI